MKMALMNLSAYRCPMILLLAKRACIQLQVDQTLKLLVTDSASIGDILRYVRLNGFAASSKKRGEITELYIKIKR